MKKLSLLLLLLVGIFSLSMISCGDDEKTISTNNLPQSAKSFISQYYPGVNITRVKQDKDNGRIEYEAYLSNGHDVTFNSSGEWLDVDAPTGQTIPAGIVPAKIEEYVNANFSGFDINEISKENYGYNVELTNGIDLEFNSNGEFIRVD